MARSRRSSRDRDRDRGRDRRDRDRDRDRERDRERERDQDRYRRDRDKAWARDRDRRDSRDRRRCGRRGGRRSSSTRRCSSRRDRRRGDGRDRRGGYDRGQGRKDTSRSRPRRGYGGGGGSGGDGRKRKASSDDGSASGKDSDSGSSSGDSAKSNDDEIIHFDWKKGDVLNSRYEIVKLLGDGTFGRVLQASDRQNGRQDVAIKVIRDVKRYIESAKIEADILNDIRKVDPQGAKSRSAIMYDTFMHGKHYCLVFEAHGASLYDFIKQNDFRGFLMQDMQSFARQSLEGLNFLHVKLKMTHTDLKPENILLESAEPPRPAAFPRENLWLQQNGSSSKKTTTQYLRPASNKIRLIDFGNATYEDEHHSSIINTRQYRGPEVVLSAGWNEKSDIWSIGCILIELYTGELLFGTHENTEHLALMERTLGPLPSKMLANLPKAVRDKYLTHANSEWRLNWPALASSPSSERHVREQRKIAELTTLQHASFARFSEHILISDPAERPSAEESLKHFFFKEVFQD